MYSYEYNTMLLEEKLNLKVNGIATDPLALFLSSFFTPFPDL